MAALITKSFVEGIGVAVEPHVRRSLFYTATSWYDGANGGDVGSSFRLDLLRVLPGLQVPGGGIISANESGNRRPRNTTWLPVGTELGEIESTVHCVEMLQGGLYQLNAHESPYAGRSNLGDTLFDMEIEHQEQLQFLWGIEWKHLWDREHKRIEGIRAVARLLYGHLDAYRRLFNASVEYDIATVNTRADANAAKASTEAKGPTPLSDLKSRPTV